MATKQKCKGSGAFLRTDTRYSRDASYMIVGKGWHVNCVECGRALRVQVGGLSKAGHQGMVPHHNMPVTALNP